MIERPGILETIYLGGMNLTRTAEQLAPEEDIAVSFIRMANSYGVIDRPYVMAGAPDVVTKLRLAFNVPHIAEADYRKWQKLKAKSGFIDLCLWKPIVERFSGDASRVLFYLTRRLALTHVPGASLPSGAATNYATLVYVGTTDASDGTLKTVTTHYSFGTADSNGATPLTFVSAPAAGTNNVMVVYVPLYYVWVADAKRGFQVAFTEGQTLMLEEI